MTQLTNTCKAMHVFSCTETNVGKSTMSVHVLLIHVLLIHVLLVHVLLIHVLVVHVLLIHVLLIHVLLIQSSLYFTTCPYVIVGFVCQMPLLKNNSRRLLSSLIKLVYKHADTCFGYVDCSSGRLFCSLRSAHTRGLVPATSPCNKFRGPSPLV